MLFTVLGASWRFVLGPASCRHDHRSPDCRMLKDTAVLSPAVPGLPASANAVPSLVAVDCVSVYMHGDLSRMMSALTENSIRNALLLVYAGLSGTFCTCCQYGRTVEKLGPQVQQITNAHVTVIVYNCHCYNQLT